MVGIIRLLKILLNPGHVRPENLINVWVGVSLEDGYRVQLANHRCVGFTGYGLPERRVTNVGRKLRFVSVPSERSLSQGEKLLTLSGLSLILDTLSGVPRTLLRYVGLSEDLTSGASASVDSRHFLVFCYRVIFRYRSPKCQSEPQTIETDGKEAGNVRCSGGDKKEFVEEPCR